MGKTSRGIILKVLVETVIRLSSFIIFPAIAFYAGVAGYGAYNQVNTIVGFIAPLASFGLTLSAVRFFSYKVWSTKVRIKINRPETLVCSG